MNRAYWILSLFVLFSQSSIAADCDEESTLRKAIQCLERTLVPKGMVAAFNLDAGCPLGWQRYEPAAGRVIIGVRDKPHDNLPMRTYRETGGTQLFLTESQPNMMFSNGGEGLLFAKDGWSAQTSPQQRGGNAVAIMPPYVTLHYCEKL